MSDIKHQLTECLTALQLSRQILVDQLARIVFFTENTPEPREGPIARHLPHITKHIELLIDEVDDSIETTENEIEKSSL